MATNIHSVSVKVNPRFELNTECCVLVLNALVFRTEVGIGELVDPAFEILDSSYSIQWPSTNEIFIFDSNGRHTKTKALLTDSTLASMAYDDRGRLRRVVNSWRSSLEVRYPDEEEGGVAEILVDGQLTQTLRADAATGLLAVVRSSRGQVKR